MTELNQESASHHDSLLLQGSGATCQFLCFTIADEAYGVEILKIKEIRGWQSATQVPELPPFMRGVLNLRGNMVPLLDLRERFGLEQSDLGPTTVVIIVMMMMNEEEKPIGLLVDAVSRVITVTTASIKTPPDFGEQRAPDYLLGLVEDAEHMVMLLEVDCLLNEDDAACISDVAS